MNGGDVYGVPSPAALVGDCRALGFQAMAGYAYDDDVSAPDPWSSQHVAALDQADILFLPVLVLRTGSVVSGSSLVTALRALGRFTGPVAWDLEPTATPPREVLANRIAVVRAAGYGPMVGYFFPAQTQAQAYGDLVDYWWWGGGNQSTPPPGWAAIQWSATTGPSGTRYDVDNFSPVIFGGDAVPFIVLTTGNLAYFFSGGVCVQLQPGEAAYAAFLNQGVKQYTGVDDAFITAFKAAARVPVDISGTFTISGSGTIS